MDKKFKVLITTTSFQDTPGAHHEYLISQNFDIDYLRGPLVAEDLIDIIQNYDGVICGDDDYNEEVLKKGVNGKLKVLSKYGVGLDKINVELAEKLGLIVTNCPGVNQVSVAEHVLALLFCFEKNIHLQYNSVQKRSWNRLIGNEIQGKTIGIIGLGAVGKELAAKAKALGLYVIGFDLMKDKNFCKKTSIDFTNNINDIYEKCDIISLHIPHNKQTEKIINHEVIFKKLKKRPIIINTSRGKLIEKKSIISGLEKNKISAYLTDVLDIEPISENENLIGLDKVIITPHVGSRTFQSVEKQAIMAIDNLIKSL